MPHHNGIDIIIRGPHNSGRTTAARFIEEKLKNEGYKDIKLIDADPLPEDQKERFPDRMFKNMELPVRIKTQLEIEGNQGCTHPGSGGFHTFQGDEEDGPCAHCGDLPAPP